MNAATLPKPAVRIDDIARRAGVHPGTVSRALRGIAGKVSPAKRAEIESIARELGYQPNAVAAQLRTKQTNLAAIVVPDLGNPLFGPIVQGLEQQLRRHEILSLVVQTPADADERRAMVLALANRQVAGLLVLAAEGDDPMLEVARARRLPTVLVNRGSAGAPRFSSVINDDHESVRLVIGHLAGLGHRSIAHIAGPASSSTGRARRAAFEAMTAGRPFGRCPVVEAAAFTRAAGVTAARALFAARQRPSAIFAANDLLALGVLDVLRERGRRVPDDVSLVGHNDMPLMDLIAPPLTTVHVAVEQMSRQAAQLFLEHLHEPALAPSTRVLVPRLVVRQSTAAPRR